MFLGLLDFRFDHKLQPRKNIMWVKDMMSQLKNY